MQTMQGFAIFLIYNKSAVAKNWDGFCTLFYIIAQLRNKLDFSSVIWYHIPIPKAIIEKGLYEEKETKRGLHTIPV